MAPRQRIIESLDLDVSTSELEAAITVTPASETRILSILVTGTDPTETAAIANAMADEIIDMTTSSLTRHEGDVNVIDPAVVPESPVGPNVMLITVLSGIAGLLFATLVALGVEYFRNTLKHADELAELTGSPVLGEVNVGHGYRGSPVQPLVVEAMPDSKTALGYRLLASQLSFDRIADRSIKSILILGSHASDPVGELTANLAAVLTRTGRSVTLVDADDLDAQMTGMFVPDRRAGLSELLALAAEAVADTDAIENVRVKRAPGIELIPAGSKESRIVREDTLAALLRSLSDRSDLVLVSGAPIHRSSQSLVWARHTDGVLVVARADTTRVENVRQTVESLRLVDATILGNVLLVDRAGGRERSRGSGAVIPADNADSLAPLPRKAGTRPPNS